MGLTNAEIDGVLAQSQPLLQKRNQRSGSHWLWITADDHQLQSKTLTLAAVSARCLGRRSSRTD